MIGETGELLGTVDEGRAYATIHPGAVYLQQGEQYVVQELDLVDRVATVSPADPDFYTQARDVTDIEVVEALERGTTGDVDAFFGTVRVTDQVVSYVRKLVVRTRRSRRSRCRCRRSRSRPARCGGRSRRPSSRAPA